MIFQKLNRKTEVYAQNIGRYIGIAIAWFVDVFLKSINFCGRIIRRVLKFIRETKHEFRVYIVRESGNMMAGKFFRVYSISGAIYFLYLWQFGMPNKVKASFFMTLGLLTGGDPYSFKEVIMKNNILWIGAWLIHLMSWLIIPAIIGFVIGEKINQMRADDELQISIRDFVKEAVHNPQKRTEAEIRMWELANKSDASNDNE